MLVLPLLALFLQTLTGPDAVRFAAELDQKAGELFRSGQYDQAAQYQKRALVIWSEISRSQQVDLTAPHFNLAQMYLAQGKLSAAEQEARSARQALPEPTNPALRARVSILFAQIDFQMGEYEEAGRELQVALPDLGGVEKATALNDLGMTSAALGNLDEARRFINASLAIREQTAAHAGADYARILANLALVCYRQGDLSAADSLYAKAIPIMEGAGEPDRTPLAMALVEYSQVLKKVGRRSEAKVLEKRAKAAFAASQQKSMQTVDVRNLR